MGTTNSKDTKRISFINTFAVTNALEVSKSIEDVNILNIEALSAVAKNTDEFNYPETKVVGIRKEDNELNYWANRIHYLQKEHRATNKIIESEYEKNLENITPQTETHVGLSSKKHEKIKTCLKWRAKILKCYEDNPLQPLTCSPIVQAFTDCVTSCKMQEAEANF